ncbi:phage tail tape measure protein [Photobacterium galatheae]|uniref:Tail tape measure protein n=1 Tax=Photobacterium galatheae TaxID=1654360 RepID=A0A066RH12_9GAMM|nr:phage tail tape measure protein [Photobacterium galatheae]KDM89695.1 tail tape measure protein [Photobacterium galatheae]MCM0151553.1 phage tail tape measure protein [Photobacterium galatheae]
MALPEPLRFTVGLIDQISKPLGNIQRQFNDMTSSYRDGTHTMVAGAAGVAGAGIALQQALMPAIEMDRALGEVKALGVTDDHLKAITKTALNFSAEYGQSAVEVIRHSEGIKNAIGDMPPAVMASATQSSATLAMAMKSDAQTVSRYLKNLYGNYQQQADAMGKDAWVAQIAGMTAEVKRLYGVEMDAIEGMIDGQHSLASTMGMSFQDQLSTFGFLSQQMSEGDANTQLTNFLEGALEAQKNLNVAFTDTNGQLLPMQQILKNVKPLIDDLSGANARKLLDDAGLGDGSLMLINMVKNMESFKSGYEAIGRVQGLGPATEMASTMADQWQRLEQGIFAIRAAFGSALLPSLLPVVQYLSDGAQEVVTWTQLFPNLTRVVGYGVIAVLGLAAAGGVLTLMAGIGKQAMATYMLTMKLFAGVTFLLGRGMTFLRGAVFAANLVMAANPIVLVVGAVVAAVAAVGALIYYWDDLKARFGDTTWFQILENAISLFTLPFRAAFALVRAGWQWVLSGFSDTSGFEFIGQMAGEIYNIFGGVFEWLKSMWDQIGTAMKGMLDWLPGFGGDDETASIQAVQAARPVAQVPQGGAAKALASYQSSSTHFGGVSIYAQQMNNPQDFANEMEMYAG